MRFLIDNALSPAVAEGLRRLGHEATHVRDYGYGAAPDEAIFALAQREDRIVVSRTRISALSSLCDGRPSHR